MSTKVTFVHAVKKVAVSKNTEEEWVCNLRSHNKQRVGTWPCLISTINITLFGVVEGPQSLL